MSWTEPASIFDVAIPTVTAAALGFGSSLVLALALSMVSSRNHYAKQFLLALALLTATVPVLGYALIADSLLSAANPLPFLLAASLSFGPLTVTCVHTLGEAAAQAPWFLRSRRVRLVRRLIRYDVPYGASSLLTGMRIAVPPALLGAMLGEFIGSSGPGLGTVLVVTTRSGHTTRAVMIAGTIVALCLVASWLVWLAQLLLRARLRLDTMDARLSFSDAHSDASAMAILLWTLVTGLIVWGFLAAARPDSVRLIKTPVELFQFAVGTQFAAQEFANYLGITARRVLVATTLAVVLAYAASALPRSIRSLASVTSGLAFVIQSIPALALFPLISAVIRQNAVAGIIVAGLSGFYPIFMTLVERRTTMPNLSLGFVTSERASWWRQEWLVFGPWVAPLVLTGCRVALPQIVSAVLVVEYLWVGNGAGEAIPRLSHRGQYYEIWVIIVSLFAGVAASLFVLQHCEHAVLRRLGFVTPSTARSL